MTVAVPGWLDIDITPYNIVTGDFYVAMESITGGGGPPIGYDVDLPVGPSYGGTPGNWVGFDQGRNIMIRAEVDPTPVGGVVYSPNTLGLLSPLLIVTGLIGAIVISSFVVKKRRT